jgi:Fic family protein
LDRASGDSRQLLHLRAAVARTSQNLNLMSLEQRQHCLRLPLSSHGVSYALLHLWLPSRGGQIFRNAHGQIFWNRQRPLTLADILEIHLILGDGALDTPEGAGRIRRADENVRVEDAVTGDVWFIPPHADELPGRLDKLLEFANNDDPKPFLHPLIRAIVLHFWLAYLHPFVDGNGRMARALFYWQMLRSGYDFAQYLSISCPIDRSRRAYHLAFAHTESDEGDLTYFLLNQLGVLRRARRDLAAHLTERAQRLTLLSSALANAEALNRRQQEVLMYLVRKPNQPVTVAGHQKSHGISYLTARKDLQALEAQQFLRRVRVGKLDRYLPTADLVERLTVGVGHQTNQRMV